MMPCPPPPPCKSRKKKTERERRHKENKLDDNGLPKTIETAVGVNCRVAHVGAEEKEEGSVRLRQREEGGNARGEIVPLTKFTTCVCGDDDDDEDENGDH